MIGRYLAQEETVSELAREYGVSRKTVYKWIERFEGHGVGGLEERSRAPHRQARALSPEMERRIVEWKARKPLWGAPKIHSRLQGMADCPAESTVSNVLARHGLSRRARRRVAATPSQSLLEAVERSNQVWCADFKGWFRTGNGQRCEPLTISDAHSRYLLRCQATGGSTATVGVMPLFVATFREYGMPEVIRTDNGAPFASTGLGGLSRLSVWWIRLGIRPERIEPGQPQQNGRHERMHRTLKEATARPPARTLGLQQRAFDAFVQEYNQERPHEALGQKPPGSVYVPSARDFPERLPAQEGYPEEWHRRTVRPGGRIRWKGHEINVSRSLSGQEIGLKPVGEGLWAVYFERLELGVLDERRWRLCPARSLVWVANLTE